MEIIKHIKTLGTLIIRPIEKQTVKEIIVKNHYSHKWNDSFGLINFGIFRSDSDKCLGAAVFGRMMNSHSFKSISNDLEKDEIIELNRLWVDDCLGISLYKGSSEFCRRTTWVRNNLQSNEF